MSNNNNNYKFAFILVTSLFFLWAIAHNLNDILITQFQKALSLSRGEAGLVQFSFYIAYAVAALPAGIIMKRFGFKKAIISGLCMYAFGALLFYPAAEVREYSFFLVALFIIACGIVFLETAGSGYITLTAPKGQSVRRINFSQSFNGIGAVIAPILGGVFIFSGIEHSADQLSAMTPQALDAYHALEAKQVQIPYLAVAFVVLLVAALVAFTPFARSAGTVKTVAKKSTVLKDLLSTPHFLWAVFGQFFYVGAQIGIWSYFIDFTKELSPVTPEKTAAFYLSASLFCFMVGRFTGTFFMKHVAPRKLLKLYALACIGLIGLALVSSGLFAVAALAATAFFMSIMFPTIYGLGLEELGDNAEIASSIIIMSIISGAFIPPAIGYMADETSVQSSYIIPLLCFVCVFVATIAGKNKNRSGVIPASKGV